MKTTNELLKLNGLPFDIVSGIIEREMNSSLIQSLPFCKMYQVTGHPEISHISNTIKSLGSQSAEVKFIFHS